MKIRLLQKDFWRSDTGIISIFVLFKLLLHFFTNGNYGYFRDEFYYIECSNNLDFGYVDQPPLSILILYINRFFLGDSLFALRFLPAVFGSGILVLTGLIVKQLNGKKYALILSLLAIIFVPDFLFMHTFYSMNVFDHFFWSLLIYILILIIKNDNPRLWIYFGITCGLGMQNKISVGFLCFGLFIALILTKERKYFLNKYFWIGAAIAFIIFLPHIIWQFNYSFPTLEFMGNATKFKNVSLSPLEFLVGVIIEMNPVLFPIWFLGIYYFLFNKNGKIYQIFSIIFISIFILFIFQKAKAYYLAPIFPILFAGGSIMIEEYFEKKKSIIWKYFIIIPLIIFSCAITPLTLPILPLPTLISYMDSIGFKPTKAENHKMGSLPQHFADMFGWENMVRSVAEVYHGLPEDEQKKCAIFSQNYGEAGALDFYSEKYNLPKSICTHNNYYYWRRNVYSGEILIILGGRKEDHLNSFEDVQEVGIVTNDYVMPYENNLKIFVCRKLKMDFKKAWEGSKKFI